MNEEKRRKIAREFLEKNFGKRKQVPQEVVCALAETMNAETIVKVLNYLNHDFELWKNYKSMKSEGEARAFDVLYPPYISGNKNPVIVVGESYEEIDEIAKLIIPEDRLKLGLPEYEKYKGYYIMFD